MSWRQEQGADRFFRLAKEEGYRARSAYKLLEMANKYKLLRPGDTVLDLGAAPGSWSQVAYQRVGQAGRVIAVDLQPIETLPGVQSIVGDIRDRETQKQVRQLLHGKADLVLSDIAPSSTGITVTDQARSMELATMALNTAIHTLKPGGAFVVKVFRGEGYGEFMAEMRTHFKKVNAMIPRATREESREAFVIGRGFIEVGREPTRTAEAPRHEPNAKVVRQAPPEGW